MPDNTLQTILTQRALQSPTDALQKASGIGADPNPYGVPSQAVMPLDPSGAEGAVGLAQKLPYMLRSKLAGAPAANVLIDMLNNFTAKEPPLDYLNKIALESRTTGSIGYPRAKLNLPNGFTTSEGGWLPQTESNRIYNAYQRLIKPLQKPEFMPPTATADSLGDVVSAGPDTAGQIKKPIYQTSERVAVNSRNAAKRAILNPEKVRQIRALGNLQKAMEAFPNIKSGTLSSVLSNQTWNSVK